ncbi:MAG: adenosylcobinamide-phosphate synthase CbiB [Desulfomonilaceae bacterium]|jgi:adenosylcobinamide-phosphate synthase
MLAQEIQLLAAIVLDSLIGDPRWWPHPVRLIGTAASAVEHRARMSIRNERVAGVLTATIIVASSGFITYACIYVADWLTPWLGGAVSIFIMYTGIAAHDLAKHAREIQMALDTSNLQLARQRVGMICGRDTGNLDKEGVVRATVESVAENCVDGVTAPLFYGALAGPVGVIVYKAVSTLDSTFGYKNERYGQFGWASARLDDAAAFAPSRLTGFLVPIAAWILGMRSQDSFRIFKRDRLKHASPNSGHTEAAFAGAMGLRLGGTSSYQGVAHEKPFIGDPVSEINSESIGKSVKLMNATTIVSFVSFVALWTIARLLWGYI